MQHVALLLLATAALLTPPTLADDPPTTLFPFVLPWDTGLTFAEDPAVAFVEINNENGLVHSWLDGDVDKLPEAFRQELRKQWNGWLRAHHGSTEKLKAAWSAKEAPLGAELLRDTGFDAQLKEWVLKQHAGAAASTTIFATDTGAKGVRIAVSKSGSEPWHVQFHQRELKIAAGQPCTLAFRARAAAAQSIRVTVEQAHEPWNDLGLSTTISLTPQWREFSFAFNPPIAEENARLASSSLGGEGAVVELAGVSLRPGGVFGLAREERIEPGTVPTFAKDRIGERTPEAQRDWLRFLWETEDAYWQATRGFCPVADGAIPFEATRQRHDGGLVALKSP